MEREILELLIELENLAAERETPAYLIKLSLRAALEIRRLSMPNFKKIKDYSPEELNSSIDQAELYCKDKGLEFYKILNGIDAYFERRRRKEEQGYPLGFN